MFVLYYLGLLARLWQALTVTQSLFTLPTSVYHFLRLDEPATSATFPVLSAPPILNRSNISVTTDLSGTVSLYDSASFVLAIDGLAPLVLDLQVVSARPDLDTILAVHTLLVDGSDSGISETQTSTSSVAISDPTSTDLTVYSAFPINDDTFKLTLADLFHTKPFDVDHLLTCTVSLIDTDLFKATPAAVVALGKTPTDVVIWCPISKNLAVFESTPPRVIDNKPSLVQISIATLTVPGRTATQIMDFSPPFWLTDLTSRNEELVVYGAPGTVDFAESWRFGVAYLALDATPGPSCVMILLLHIAHYADDLIFGVMVWCVYYWWTCRRNRRRRKLASGRCDAVSAGSLTGASALAVPAVSPVSLTQGSLPSHATHANVLTSISSPLTGTLSATPETYSVDVAIALRLPLPDDDDDDPYGSPGPPCLHASSEDPPLSPLTGTSSATLEIVC